MSILFYIKLTNGDGTLASIQLKFQIAVVPERRLSRYSVFFCNRIQLCMSPLYKIYDLLFSFFSRLLIPQ